MSDREHGGGASRAQGKVVLADHVLHEAFPRAWLNTLEHRLGGLERKVTFQRLKRREGLGSEAPLCAPLCEDIPAKVCVSGDERKVD